MITSLVYHHYGIKGSKTDLRKDFEHLQRASTLVLPGETLTNKKPNVCVTFDDAGADFYLNVFPLLREFKIRVVLAVATSFIDQKVTVPNNVRLDFAALQPLRERSRCHFCSWNEIREMADSGLVHVAAHGITHANLARSRSYESEILGSKHEIEERLARNINTFVLPYGMFNRASISLARAHYNFVFGLGRARQSSWQGISGVFYRSIADDHGAEEAIRPTQTRLQGRIGVVKMHLKTQIMLRRPELLYYL